MCRDAHDRGSAAKVLAIATARKTHHAAWLDPTSAGPPNLRNTLPNCRLAPRLEHSNNASDHCANGWQMSAHAKGSLRDGEQLGRAQAKLDNESHTSKHAPHNESSTSKHAPARPIPCCGTATSESVGYSKLRLFEDAMRSKERIACERAFVFEHKPERAELCQKSCQRCVCPQYPPQQNTRVQL